VGVILSESRSFSDIVKIIGPGILYAAAAVGISHLVQATRAGAVYGLSLTAVIIFACMVKYPGIRFGTDYAVATGNNLIISYIKQGRLALAVFLLNVVFTVLFVPVAIALVTAGLLKGIAGIDLSDLVLTAIVLFSAGVILIRGQYRFLERMTKLLVAVFTVLIFIAVIVVIGKVDWAPGNFLPPPINPPTLFFIVIITGFMPSPMTAGTIISLWITAKARQTGVLPTHAEARLDFNIGYFTSFILALSFMLLGAGIMYGTGVEFAASSGGFARQIIAIFTQTIGGWSFWLIGGASIAVMYSSVLTVLDGNVRFVQILLGHFFPNLESYGVDGKSKLYNIIVVCICIGAAVVLSFFMQSFRAFIDLVSVVVAITAPLMAILNHRAMRSDEIPDASRPTRLMVTWSLLGIIIMSVVSLCYLYFRFAA
jgi:Mn2+/Fe2+ NRAMP family transporter